MKTFFRLFVLANLALDIASYFILPQTAAVHFGASGAPNGWFSAGAHLVFSLVLQGTFFIVIEAMRVMLPNTPVKQVNLPNKHYWLTEKHLPEFRRRWDTLASALGCIVMLLFLAISCVIIEANRLSPVQLDGTVFVTIIAVFVVLLGAWMVSLYRTLRIPS
jgi:uncharacterized membrane protein